ncbi:MAG: efflux RND transporter periplasmic adaptor subunit [Candidatus Binataceae bacterium]
MTARDFKSARAAIALAAALSALIGPGCGGAHSGDDAASAPAPTPVLLVTAASATIEPMRQEVNVIGSTVALTHVTIRSPTAGRVIDIHIRNGDTVRKGQVIAHVVNREIEAARAGLAVAKRLDPQDSAALGKSVGRYDQGPGIPIVAPESGIVSKPPIVSGQMVSDLDTIAELVNPASIYVNADVPIGEVHLIHPGMAAIVTSPLRPGAEFPARVVSIFPNFDLQSATAPVRIDFTRSQGIYETDAPVEVRITVSETPDAIVIPSAALYQDAGENRYHVFVVGAGGRARRVEVSIGIRQRGRVQVIGAIKSGDEVITSGGYTLSDGLRVKVGGAQ